jgi:hypothetical protein
MYPTIDGQSIVADIIAQLLGFRLGMRNTPKGTLVTSIPPIIGSRIFLGEDKIVIVTKKTNKKALKNLINKTEDSIFVDAKMDIVW